MLKIIRITLAALSLVAVTLLFLDVTGFAAAHWGWFAKVQLMPAVMSLNIGVLVALAAVTLLMGRVYCSVICPLGIYQDVVSRIKLFIGGRAAKNRYKYHAQYKHVRYTVFTLFVVLLILGLTNVVAAALAGLLEPYSEYGRMASELMGLGYDGVNNLLADWSEANDNYVFSHVAHAMHWPLLIVALVTFAVVTIFAWVGGREYCNAVCPVGTALGFLSRYAWLRPVIDKSRCNGCRKCERNCKASCIDGKNHKIDYSRCVACMDCLSNCSQKAISFRHPVKIQSPEVPAEGRRSFITTGALVTAALVAKAHEGGDGALAPIKIKRRPVREVNPVPAGAKSVANMMSHCTSCQLCVRSCPNGVLHPSVEFDSFMQPVMWFNEGYCRLECTKCSDVCPSGAILPVNVEDKSSIKIGTAVVDAGLCISASAGQHCGLCSRSCPTGAIKMVMTEDGNRRPVVNEEACIGCGSCEYHCPVGTAGHIRADHAAIHVEGIEVHRIL